MCGTEAAASIARVRSAGESCTLPTPNVMKPILSILLFAICALVLRHVNASESTKSTISEAEVVSEVIAIKYAKASSIADALDNLGSRDGGVQFSIQRLIADERSNSLLISTTRSGLEAIKRIVSKLDVMLPQILIEGAILKVQLPDTRSAAGRHSGRQSHAPVDRFLASGALWFTNLILIPVSTTNGVASQQDGFSYLAELGKGFDPMVAALGSDRRVTILQKPRIQTSSGVSATIWLSEVHFPRNYSCSTYPGPPIPQFWIEQWGEIEVTPSIRPDGLIVMEIQASANKVIEKTHIAGVGDVPNTSSTRSRASAAVRDGDILMIGGATIPRKQRLSGIPALKHIPVLGSLFRGASAVQFRSEIIVQLRPTLLRGPTVERPSH